MRLIYNIGVQLYFVAIYFIAFFNKKAKLWIDGRKTQSFIRYQDSIWFHFASLGEFEQGRPVLEQMRALYPPNKIVITLLFTLYIIYKLKILLLYLILLNCLNANILLIIRILISFLLKLLNKSLQRYFI